MGDVIRQMFRLYLVTHLSLPLHQLFQVNMLKEIKLSFTFSFMYMFCRSLFVLLSFFVWPLCCLFLDIRILITPLISSDCSSVIVHYVHMWSTCSLWICFFFTFLVVYKNQNESLYIDWLLLKYLLCRTMSVVSNPRHSQLILRRVKTLLHGKASIVILVSCNFLYHDPCHFTQ